MGQSLAGSRCRTAESCATAARAPPPGGGSTGSVAIAWATAWDEGATLRGGCAGRSAAQTEGEHHLLEPHGTRQYRAGPAPVGSNAASLTAPQRSLHLSSAHSGAARSLEARPSLRRQWLHGDGWRPSRPSCCWWRRLATMALQARRCMACLQGQGGVQGSSAGANGCVQGDPLAQGDPRSLRDCVPPPASLQATL